MIHGTSIFVERVTRLWKILNIRSPGAAKYLNDPGRLKVTDGNDERLILLSEMATMFKTTDSCKQGKQMNTLTGDTSNELHVTLLGMVDLIKTLLSSGHKYVLPEKIQSDRVGGEFGYRQNSGNYFILVEQVISSLNLERIKLFKKLDLQRDENIVSDYSTATLDLSEEELHLLDHGLLEYTDVKLQNHAEKCEG